MLCLRDLQVQFTQALFSGKDASIENVIEAGNLGPAARMGIYRNNVLSNYRNALRDTYPVILRLVGDEFFNAAAKIFAKQSASSSGDLHDFGEDFGEFLDAFAPAQGLPYLAGVARLEWAVHRVFHAADSEPLELSRLAKFSDDQLPALRFTLNPAVRLVESMYPIARIWEVSQPGYAGDATVSLDDGAQRVLVSRRDYATELRPLSAGEHSMLQALSTGHPLGEALGQALAADQNFDVQKFMAGFVAISTFTDVRL
jgi:hypothetical protein